MFENKLMKTVSDAAVITEIKAGYRWIAKKVTKRVDDFWLEFQFRELCEDHSDCHGFSCNEVIPWRPENFTRKLKFFSGLESSAWSQAAFFFIHEREDIERERMWREFFAATEDAKLQWKEGYGPALKRWKG